jgi:hypothetical protein
MEKQNKKIRRLLTAFYADDKSESEKACHFNAGGEKCASFTP